MDSARDRLQVIEPGAAQRPGRTGAAGPFSPSVDQEISPAIPGADEMTDLERSARRNLVAGPETTLAEIKARDAAVPRGVAGYGRSNDAGFNANPRGDRSDRTVTVTAVRLDDTRPGMDDSARRAVRDAVAAFDGSGVIAVRGDASDARFADRAGRLVRALTGQGVDRRNIEVIWGRSYGDTPERLELAVTPAGRRY